MTVAVLFSTGGAVAAAAPPAAPPAAAAAPEAGPSMPAYYLVKWITWKEKKTPIITQSENGPCPLLAIMNTLFLRWKVRAGDGQVEVGQVEVRAGDRQVEVRAGDGQVEVGQVEVRAGDRQVEVRAGDGQVEMRHCQTNTPERLHFVFQGKLPAQTEVITTEDLMAHLGKTSHRCQPISC